MARRHVLVQQFSVADPKGANGFSFEVPDGFEPLHGTGADIKGSIQFNMDDPSKSTGSVSIGLDTLKLTSADMTKNIYGDWCLNTAKYPRAELVVKSAKLLETKGTTFVGEVDADLTIKGITKPVKLTGTAKYAKNAAKVRFGDKEGDLLIIRASFSFLRSDFKIADEALNPLVVGNKIEVTANIAGAALK